MRPAAASSTPHCILPFLLTANSPFSPPCHSTPPPIPTLSPLTHRQTSGLRKGKDQGLLRPVKNVHTLPSHTHTHAHAAPFCRCRSTCTPAAPSSETLNEDRNYNRTSIAPFLPTTGTGEYISNCTYNTTIPLQTYYRQLYK